MLNLQKHLSSAGLALSAKCSVTLSEARLFNDSVMCTLASNQPNTIRPMTFDLNPMMDKPDFLLSPFGHTLVRCL